MAPTQGQTLEAAGRNTDAKDIIDTVERLAGVELYDLADPVSGDQATFAAVPKDKTLHDMRQILDAHLTRPRRAEGTMVAQDSASFIELVNRFKDDNSRIFAKADPSQPSLTAVLDHHQIGSPETEPYAKLAPRFGRHRVSYLCPLSNEWQAWMRFNGQARSQKEFAEFLEDRLGDVTLPETLDEGSKKLVESLGARVGGPSSVLALSRGLEVNVGVRVKNAVTLATGEISIIHEETHSDSAGQPIKTPNLFFIAIPVFLNGAPYRIPVRLRYRNEAGALKWFYQLHRPDLSIDHAFREIVEKVRTETALLTVLGSPEN